MVELMCQRCGYEWEFNGKLMLASCPNCGSKVRVPQKAKRNI